MRLRVSALLLVFSAFLGAQDTAWPTAGWTTSSPEEQGLTSAGLEQAAQYIEGNSPTRFSLLVVRHGRLVFERYFHGSQASDPNNIKSVSKSVISVLTGIQLDEGLWRGTGQTVYEFFPEYFIPGDDPRKRDVTIAHLLTMTAGFQQLETGEASDRWFHSPDWNRFLISVPLVHPPGEVWEYSTALSHMLSGILTKASGVGTRDYATSRLFDPLGITCYRWDQDPTGLYFGGSQVFLTARDLAKFGLLVLRDGRWEGRTIVSTQWLRASTRLRVRTNSVLGDYGYFWWKYTALGYPVTLGMGYGGQYLFLVPDLDLIVVTTARSDTSAPDPVYLQPYDILRLVLQAVQAPPPQLNEGGVVNSADFTSRLAAGSFASAFGAGFSLVSTTWDDAMPIDGRLPSGIAGVRMTLGGRSVHPAYVSPTQVNFLVPPDQPNGRYWLQISTPQGGSGQYVDVSPFAPALFTTYRDGAPMAALLPVRPGGDVALWASGLGPSIPPLAAGSVLAQPLPLANVPEVTVAGRDAEVLYSALAFAGVWQINIRVPAGLPTGLASVQIRLPAAATQRDAFLDIAP